MDSPRTHALCLPCWGLLEPDQPPRAQFTWTGRQTEICCRCAARTQSGIYYQAPPLKLACLGRHAAARAAGPAAPDDLWQLAVDQLEQEGYAYLTEIADQAGELERVTLPRLGQPIRSYPGPFPRGPFDPWLPTQPGTYLQYAGRPAPPRPPSRWRRWWRRRFTMRGKHA